MMKNEWYQEIYSEDHPDIGFSPCYSVKMKSKEYIFRTLPDALDYILMHPKTDCTLWTHHPIPELLLIKSKQ